MRSLCKTTLLSHTYKYRDNDSSDIRAESGFGTTFNLRTILELSMLDFFGVL